MSAGQPAPLLALEPIAALGSVLFSLKMAKLDDPALGAQLASLDARSKQTRSADTAGWAAIYQDALGLITLALEVQRRASQERQRASAQQALRQQLGALSSAIPSRLQRALSDWNGRLQEQTTELRAKLERSVERLASTSVDDAVSGQTIYQIEEPQLVAFWAWLAGATTAWRANNGALVATRANDTIGDLRAQMPPEVHFEVRPAPLEPTPWTPPRLKGFRVPTAGRFAALGTTYKTVMGAVMAVSSVGFLATRLVGTQAVSLLPWMFGAVFAVALVYAGVTVPRQHRQALALQRDLAAERVHAEVLAAAREHLDQVAAHQLLAIRKHLTQTEEQRWARLVHEATGGSLPPGGLALGGPLGLASGLSEPDQQRLAGEWRDAIAARLAQLTPA